MEQLGKMKDGAAKQTVKKRALTALKSKKMYKAMYEAHREKVSPLI